MNAISTAKKRKLEAILNEIKRANESIGCPIGESQSNEVISKILEAYGIADDAEEIEAAFGLDGLNAIRDAENGVFQ